MRKIGQYVLVFVLISLIGASAYYVYNSSQNPCEKPLKYSIGRFDTQFGISKAEFIKYVSEAEVVWEKALNRDVFIYDPSSNFKINLIYDERQLATIQKQKTEFGLSAVEKAFRELDTKFSAFKSQYESRTAAYESALSVFNAKRSDYEKEVSAWNKKGGAPKNEFDLLETQRQALNAEAERLNKEAAAINAMANELNSLLKERNIKALEYNRMVESYNQKYGKELEFNQAEYTGNAINVYQFGTKKDLVFALAHEFGHALGLNHVDGSDSIMYYLTDGNTQSTLALSQQDIAELKKVCKIK